MPSLSGHLPKGLRPVSRRISNLSDLNRQTSRIVMPKTTRTAQPVEAAPVPKVVPRVVSAPTTKFYLMPSDDQELLTLFPQGIRLTSEWLYVGRNPYNAIPAFLALVLKRDDISNIHAAVMEFHGKVYVADLGSSNGTKIIRNQVTYAVNADPVELLPDDALGIGSILFRIVQQ